MDDMVSQSVGVELGRWNVLGCVMDVARKLDCVVIIYFFNLNSSIPRQRWWWLAR